VIVLLLLARNERDLLRANIEHHLDWGIDHVCVGDHKSTDGTQDMLAEFGDAVTTIVFSDFFTRQVTRSELVEQVRERCGEPEWVGVSDSDEFWWAAGTTMKEILAEAPADRAAVNFQQKLYLPTVYDATDEPVTAQRAFCVTDIDSALNSAYRRGKSWYRGSYRKLYRGAVWFSEHFDEGVGHPPIGPPEPMVHHYMIVSEEQFLLKVKRLTEWRSSRARRRMRFLDPVYKLLRRPIPKPVSQSSKAEWWDVFQRGGEDGLRDYYRNVYTLDRDRVAKELAAGELHFDPSFPNHSRERLGLPPLAIEGVPDASGSLPTGVSEPHDWCPAPWYGVDAPEQPEGEPTAGVTVSRGPGAC
jgi:hypothetical protein